MDDQSKFEFAEVVARAIAAIDYYANGIAAVLFIIAMLVVGILISGVMWEVAQSGGLLP